MGWRDRDYAKWTDEERQSFYGSGPTFTGARRSTRVGLGPGVGLAVLVSGALALGQLPLNHPLVPAFQIGGRTAPAATLSLPPTAALGSTLSVQGTAATGPVTVNGSYDGGRTWIVLSSSQSIDGVYTTEIHLAQQGELSIKIVFADGSTATGSIVVQ
ncbi:MAG TPA: hypothetical protein VGH79_08695 [Gaiellaceae bacterium]|jgi:hypothetical protein